MAPVGTIAGGVVGGLVVLVVGIVAVMYMRLLHKRARAQSPTAPPPPPTGTGYDTTYHELAAQLPAYPLQELGEVKSVAHEMR